MHVAGIWLPERARQETPTMSTEEQTRITVEVDCSRVEIPASRHPPLRRRESEYRIPIPIGSPYNDANQGRAGLWGGSERQEGVRRSELEGFADVYARQTGGAPGQAVPWPGYFRGNRWSIPGDPSAGGPLPGPDLVDGDWMDVHSGCTAAYLFARRLGWVDHTGGLEAFHELHSSGAIHLDRLETALNALGRGTVEVLEVRPNSIPDGIQAGVMQLELNGPAHVVAFRTLEGDQIEIVDPAAGVARVAAEQLESALGGGLVRILTETSHPMADEHPERGADPWDRRVTLSAILSAVLVATMLLVRRSARPRLPGGQDPHRGPIEE